MLFVWRFDSVDPRFQTDLLSILFDHLAELVQTRDQPISFTRLEVARRNIWLGWRAGDHLHGRIGFQLQPKILFEFFGSAESCCCKERNEQHASDRIIPERRHLSRIPKNTHSHSCPVRHLPDVIHAPCVNINRVATERISSRTDRSIKSIIRQRPLRRYRIRGCLPV